jgi:hypothetical protein
MSPSSSSSASSAASINQIGGPQSNASTTSCSSSSSSSTNAKSTNKQRRQTIAALAAAAAAAGSQNTNPQAPTNNANSQMQSDLQRNLVALASQFGIKTESANFDQMLQDINADKNKLLSTLTPNPMNRKQIKNKKAHLLSASANTTPTNMNTLPIINGKQKVKKKSINGAHFQDSSNLQNQAAAAAAAAALQSYQQLINNTLAKQAGSSPNKYRGNGYYNPDDPEDENNRQYEDDEEDYDMKGGENNYNQTGGPVKSLSTTPLTQNNTNQTGPVMTPNLEFECTACEKKFKYYCYYKRHMDACHSEWPKYVCETCNKSYKWEASYRQHLRSHHGIMGPTSNGSEPNMTNGASGEMNTNGNNGEYNSEDEMMDEQNAGYDNEINTSQKEQAYNENLDEEDDIDSQEQDIEQQINQSQNEHQQKSYDNEQIGAAGALASIADSINSSNAASGVLVGNRD